MSSKIKFPKNIIDYYDFANTRECSLWAWVTEQPRSNLNAYVLFEEKHPEYKSCIKDNDSFFIFICKIGYLYYINHHKFLANQPIPL